MKKRSIFFVILYYFANMFICMQTLVYENQVVDASILYESTCMKIIRRFVFKTVVLPSALKIYCSL